MNIVILICIAILFFPNSSQAYVDPGVLGTLGQIVFIVINVIVVMLVSLLKPLRRVYSKIRSIFKRDHV